MDLSTQPGAFFWNELLTTDPEAACEFYGALFGWQFLRMPTPDGEYALCRLGPTSMAGIVRLPVGASAPLQPTWSPYVTVAALDTTLAQAIQLGGRLVVGPTLLPGIGRVATLFDPQGATVHLWEPETPVTPAAPAA